VIWIVGGTMFGYCATGRNDIVARPNTKMKMLMTVANRGWLMKKWAIFTVVLQGLRVPVLLIDWDQPPLDLMFP